MLNNKIDKEWVEESKKWVFLDRSRFSNYKIELNKLDTCNTIEEFIDWIKFHISDIGPMTGLGKTALECIYQQILVSNITIIY